MAKTKVIERKPLTFAEKTFIPQIATGLKTTMKAMFDKTVTLEYPEQRPVIPNNYRGVPTLVKDPNGREKCVSCQLCEFVCPPKAIRITPGEIDAETDPERAHVERRHRNLKLTCSVAFIAACAKKSVQKKRSSCKTSFHSLVIVAKR